MHSEVNSDPFLENRIKEVQRNQQLIYILQCHLNRRYLVGLLLGDSSKFLQVHLQDVSVDSASLRFSACVCSSAKTIYHCKPASVYIGSRK